MNKKKTKELVERLCVKILLKSERSLVSGNIFKS